LGRRRQPARATLLDRLDQALNNCPTGEKVAVVHLDIDLPDVDTTCGPVTRDTVLRTVTERLKELTRTCETAAQIDDRTFAVVLQHLPAGLSAHALVHRATTRLTRPINTLHGPLAVTVSIGAACANPANPAHRQNWLS
jgi:diguanylate cyclase (GGDEF)-like protein